MSQNATHFFTQSVSSPAEPSRIKKAINTKNNAKTRNTIYILTSY